MMRKIGEFFQTKWKSYSTYIGSMGVMFSLFIGIRLFMFGTETSDFGFWEKFTSEHYSFAVPMPDQVDFAGENVPLNDYDVRERLDKELHSNTYFQSQTLQYFKKANRWFPEMEKILKQYQVPTDFKYLAVIESGLSNVVSPAGATGYWQFMKATAEQYGLKVTEEIDERYDPIKSTHAAAKYLRDAYRELGNWTLVAASYNMGVGGISRQAAKQKQVSYYDLYLNTETSKYLPRILAVKEIMQNPRKYGFRYRTKDLYEPLRYKKINIDTSVSDLIVLAEQLGVSYRDLKLFNPWLKKQSVSLDGNRSMMIFIPDGNFVASNKHMPYDEIAVPEADFSNVIAINQPKEEAATPAVAMDTLNFRYFTKVGDDLEDIARDYATKASEIVRWNNLTSNQLQKGQVLIIKIPKPKK